MGEALLLEKWEVEGAAVGEGEVEALLLERGRWKAMLRERGKGEREVGAYL